MHIEQRALSCDVCFKAFMGRWPYDDAIVICPSCLNTLPSVEEGDAIPDTVIEEISGGRGNDDKD